MGQKPRFGQLLLRDTIATFDLDEAPTHEDVDFEYYINILKLLAGRAEFRNCHFVLVDVYRPDLDLHANTVVLLFADEVFSLPVAWAHCRLILRTYGNRPQLVWGAYGLSGCVADCLRFAFEWLKLHANIARIDRPARARLDAITIEIPLGYCRSENLPIIPILERPTLTAFAGSLSNRRLGPLPFRSIVDFIKWSSRSRLAAALQRLKAGRADVVLQLTRDFADSLSDTRRYSRDMMETMIWLAPRGTTAESFRPFEAARYGCVCICEPLPKRWFYEGAPVIELSNWHQLGPVVLGLAADPSRLQAYHLAMLEWWASRVSEPAIVDAVIARQATPARKAAA